MRFLIKLKLIALIAIWSLVCAGLYVVTVLGEAALEIGAGAAGAVVGQGGAASGLVDLTGDIIQWGLGFVWLVGALVLWFVKKRLTSGEARGTLTGQPRTAAPHVATMQPSGRSAAATGIPATRLLATMMARKKRAP